MKQFMTTTVAAAHSMPAGFYIPDGFSLAAELRGVMDGLPIILQRRVPQVDAGVALGGSHVSVVFGDGGRLMGFTRMDARLANRPLPTANEARQAAEALLRVAAPDLLQSYEVNWIERHDEMIIHAGQSTAISGMKVKCRNLADGRYYWVIVGPTLEPITFERNIVWNFAGGCRQTEKWLHDTWLASTGRTFGS